MELHKVKGECYIYEGDIVSGANVYTVAFERITSWYGNHPSDAEIREDYADGITVLIGDTMTPLESINKTTASEIEDALDRWLLAHEPEFIQEYPEPKD